MSKTIILGRRFDEERALFGCEDLNLEGVAFAGPADGESALKECRSLQVRDTLFDLRYPLWHDQGVSLVRCTLTEGCRAALWYSRDVRVSDSRLMGIKALRECDNVSIDASEVVSPEFGWNCRGVRVDGGSISSEYAFMHARDLSLHDVDFCGKYSFQYTEHVRVEGGFFDTKDAFWHASDVVVRNATLKGEYLGWYSRNLTLINCRIEGTQPFVHCEGLKLVNCEMVGCDLAFEACDVQADVRGHIDSIRDPRSGLIVADSVGELVHDTQRPFGAQLVIREDPFDCSCACA